MFKQAFFALLLVFLGTLSGWSQTEKNELIQFSGMILDGTDERLIPVPYTNVLIKGEGRGTYSDFNGFFSVVVRKGDVVEFSAVGYKTVDFVIPDTLGDNRYSLVQLMTRDTINLPEAVIFPWPSREHFRLEFLAMDVTSDLQRRASGNVAQDALARLREDLPYDGRENADYFLRQQAKDYYHIGQAPPMNIFNPIAWKDFFDAWKRGDFKKQRN
jgi:hypothetical protein